MLVRKIIIIGSIAITAVILSGCIFQNKNTNSTSNNNLNNAKETVVQDLKNGFSFIIPDKWVLEGKEDNAFNTVKNGSPMQYFNFIQQKDRGVIFGPGITASSFTIDQNLTAKDVANLAYDLKIADKITAGTDKCYSEGKEITVAGMNAYYYIYDVTDFEICNIATESSISKTVIIKNTGNQNTLMLTLVARDKNELNTLLPDFQKVLDSVKRQ